MKKLKYLIFLSLSACLISCAKTKTSETTSENIIPPDKMEKIIYDVHIVDAIVASKIIKNPTRESDSLLYSSIFEKHNVTRADFENTLLYYVNYNFDTLNAIYDRVINRFNTEKALIFK